MASKSKKRRRVLGASCILAALIIAGSSFAWFTSKDEVTNRLAASTDYGVSIVESFVPPKQWMPGQQINKDVYAVNTGNIDAFVKESISANLTYTYEKRVSDAPTNANKEGYVRLDTDSVTAIDGATTHEAGGFIAWVNQFTTIYKLNGTEVKKGTADGDVVELASGSEFEAKLDNNTEVTKFKYKYVKDSTTYVCEDLKENAVFYKVTSGTPNTVSSNDAGNLTLTVDYTPTAGEVNSATLTDVAQSADGTDKPAAVVGTRWHPTETGVYVFRRSYVPNNAADADKNAVTYKFGTTSVEESAFETKDGDWEVTDDNAGAKSGKYKYKYTDSSSNVYYGNSLDNDATFYKEGSTAGHINSSVAADKLTLTRNQEAYYTYAAYYYLAPEDDGSTADVDESKNEGEYYKVVLGSDDFRAIETDGTGTAKTYIFDVSATQYQLGYPNTIEVDPVTGKITGDVAYSFVKEIKRENVAPTLTYHHTSDTAHDSVAYLEAVYTDGTSDDGNYQNKKAIADAATSAADDARRVYFDNQGKQAAAEATYENAAGNYNSKKSRYDQAKADWDYAVALSDASKALSDAAKTRAAVQTKVDNASDALNDAWNGLKNLASDMHGTLPSDTTPSPTVTTDANYGRVFTDLLKFQDHASDSSKRTDISYNSLFKTGLPNGTSDPDTKTLEEIILDENVAVGNGYHPNYSNTGYYLLSDANSYRLAMQKLWDDRANASSDPTDASIVGASARLEKALADFANLSINANSSADATAQAMLDELKAARANMETLLKDYKELFQTLNTVNFDEGTLTALISGTDAANFESKIQAWIDRLDKMEEYIADNKQTAKEAGQLTYTNKGTANARVEEASGDSRGIDIVTQDFKKKYQDYYTANTVDLPAGKAAWEQALKDYNAAVNNTDGAGKTYHDAIYKEQRVVDEYHSKKNDAGTDWDTKVYQKNDYEGLTTNGTDTFANGSEHCYLTDFQKQLNGWYAIQRDGSSADPTIDAFENDGTIKAGNEGADLWKIIGKSGVTMPTTGSGADNFAYYPATSEADSSTPIGATAAATYTDGTNAYTRSYVADANRTDATFHTLKQYGTEFPTVKALKDTLDSNAVTKAKNDAETAYKAAIAATKAAKKESERADQVRDGAIDAANGALAADESAIRINIYLDDQNDELDWTSALADGASAEVADFYYNYILGAGLTSEKLIDSVELDKSLTARDYKELVFDLNVKLDSAQITYDNDQRTITTTAVDANDEFKMNPTVGRESTDGKGVAVTWDGSGSVSPTTIYRVGTERVEPKACDTTVAKKTVTTVPTGYDDLKGEYGYYIVLNSTTYYGKKIADGEKFYAITNAEITADMITNAITLNVVQ